MYLSQTFEQLKYSVAALTAPQVSPAGSPGPCGFVEGRHQQSPRQHSEKSRKLDHSEASHVLNIADVGSDSVSSRRRLWNRRKCGELHCYACLWRARCVPVERTGAQAQPLRAKVACVSCTGNRSGREMAAVASLRSNALCTMNMEAECHLLPSGLLATIGDRKRTHC